MPVLQKKKAKPMMPARTIAFSFLIVIIIGALLLSLPICSKSGTFTPLNETFFVSTSATCVNGLVIHDTFQTWSFIGQLIIITMIQIGGLGLVTLATFFNFAIGRKLGLRKMQTASESVNGDGFTDAKVLIKNIIKVSLSLESVGAIILMFVFVPKQGISGIFTAIFTAISAFCNAGFDLMGRKTAFISLTEYSDNPIVLITVALLVICGGLGFVVWNDLINFKNTKHLVLHTKIVLIVTLILIIFGTIMFLICEWTNTKTMSGMPVHQKLLNSFFQSITCRSSGFNSIDIAEMRPITKIFAIILMFIGAAPGSTGGGIKVTTIAVVVMTVLCVLRNREDTSILGRRVDKSVVNKSITIVILGTLTIFIASISIYYSTSVPNNESGLNTIFEVVSDFSTVGLSTGITVITNAFSQIILMIIMFLGRLGPIAFILSLLLHSSEKNKNQVLPEGKIMVG